MTTVSPACKSLLIGFAVRVVISIPPCNFVVNLSFFSCDQLDMINAIQHVIVLALIVVCASEVRIIVALVLACYATGVRLCFTFDTVRDDLLVAANVAA
jgi:NADH:ubiquinone oxidoreductase subunit K